MRLSFSRIVLPVCLAIVCSCNKTDRNVRDFKYEIVVNETLDSPSWSDLFESVSYIPLKTDVPMGQVDQIVVYDSLMYVLADGLYCFDMDGNCKFRNNNKGRARNEFLKASSLSVYDGKAYVFDRYKYKMMVFDAKTGAFIDDMSVPGYKIYSWFNGNSYICSDADPQDADYTLFKCYSKDDINTQTAAFFPRKEDVGMMFGTTSWSGDGLICLSYVRNLAWKIMGADTVPYIKVTVPENKRIPDNIASSMIADGSRSVEDYTGAEVIYGLYYLTECDGFITATIFNHEKNNTSYIFLVYDKNTGKSCSYLTLRDKEPWQQFPIAGRDNPATGCGNSIYVAYMSESLSLIKGVIGTGNEPADPRFLEPYEVFKGITNDGNPIVARYEFKPIE